MDAPSSSDPGVAVFIEFCCGSAALSAKAQQAGFQVFPIDHAGNWFRPKAAVIQIDLSAVRNTDVVVCMINFLKPEWLHFGLPCGFGSRVGEEGLLRLWQDSLKFLTRPSQKPPKPSPGEL